VTTFNWIVLIALVACVPTFYLVRIELEQWRARRRARRHGSAVDVRERDS
jgi:hypothetical protein